MYLVATFLGVLIGQFAHDAILWAVNHMQQGH